MLRPITLATFLLVQVLLPRPVFAEDKPSLKEILGRAQSLHETKAVEDLINRLKGAAPKPAVSPPPAAAAPPAPAAPESAAPATASKEITAEQPEKPAAAEKSAPAAEAPAVAATDRPAQVSPDSAVKSAEQKERPSVDLEVLFALDSAEIAPEAVAILATLGQALTDTRLADDGFLIAGHTDAKGRAAYNLRLSEARAQSVRRFLIANFGIAETRLVAKGFGRKHLKNPRQPLAAENRRVQIVNLSKAAPQR
jgi:outer membrane protein OmpA-like peptidoglycan-associated protein